MSVIYMWTTMCAVAKSLVRQCPTCRTKQIIPRKRLKETVQCKKCGSDILSEKRR